MPRTSTRFGRRHKPCPVCRKSHPVWWNSAKGRWFLSVEKDGGGFRQINLGPDHDKALDRWHRIEAGLEPTETTGAGPTTTSDGILVGELVNLFLDAPASRPSDKRYGITKRFLTRFAEAFGGNTVASLRVGGVTKVERWIDGHKTWVGCRADVVGRIKRLFNWATDEGFIASSPLKALKKPKYGVRVSYFSPEQVEAILAEANPFFSVGFRMLLLTGCRPDEICSLTRDDVGEDSTGLYLKVKHKNQKHTGAPRRIWLVPEAQQIVREQLKKFGSGRLFRSANKTTDGNRPPLSPEYFGHALRTICKKPRCKKLGLDDYEVVGGKRQYKYVAYTTRHTFAVRYLTGFYRTPATKDAPKGRPIKLDYADVASLLGNSARMVEQVYGHLTEQVQYLADRLNGNFGD